MYSQYASLAPYATEDEAVRKAADLDPGDVTYDGPREVAVDSLAEFTLRFRVGKAGMKTGGGIRLATAHGMGTDWGGNRLQTEDPKAENYLTFRASTGATLQWKTFQGVRNDLFERYHPWQNINEFKLTGPDLRPGDRIEIKLGDRSQGSPGVRIQRWDESGFTLKFYVDARGDDDYLPLDTHPRVRVIGTEAAEMHVVAPSEAEPGAATWLHVWMSDAFGNPAAGFEGAVSCEADGVENLPRNSRSRAEDRGVRRFLNVRFTRPGVFRIRCRETNGALEATSNPVTVHLAVPRQRIYWGDIHTHTMYSDGRGTPEETYDFGRRVAALDFCSVSDHSFITTDAMWREIGEVTNRFYQPGRYVTFLAYEWSGRTEVGGDHNVYTTESEFPLIRCYSYYNYRNLRMYHGGGKQANHVEDLFRMLEERWRNENILVIPHFGGRQGNPAWHNPKLQRQIEIFSDHRRSEDWASTFLARGYRLGIMASTDNHAGNAGHGVRRNQVTRGEEGDVFSPVSPAERGTSLVAAYASELTREGMFQALYHRRTYATTGSRIMLRFEVDGAPMGSEIRVTRPPRIVASAEGTAPIRSIRLVKNGRIVHAVSPGSLAGRLEYVDASGDYAGRYYYIDLVQADGEKAISSPVWVN